MTIYNIQERQAWVLFYLINTQIMSCLMVFANVNNNNGINLQLNALI